jgi:2-phospho-L-lactate transferase/gluconeogenesis factor (CofD/UPF0052 family)
MTQPGETDGFNAVDHVNAILNRTNLGRIDIVVVNSRRAAKPLVAKYESNGQFWVPPTVKRLKERGLRVVATDLLLEANLVRHNPLLLGAILVSLINEPIDKFNSIVDNDEEEEEGLLD